MTATWAARFDGAPRLIDVGGRTVCARIRGSGPTVVLEAAGTGQGTGDAWGRAVEDGLPAMATVVSYDRAGVGCSQGPPRRTITEMADDLHDLLGALALPGPAVVVSWSYGGLVSALHAVRHPGDVAGLVLVDPT
ncbi:alpha/beta fold hydrolase [Pseudonocardia humida]|uniref:Alpha/beta hydrolase n=1 Tax=Pseudonocardia humida TaxID=2800819 RepID=A0ABT1A8X9_9PSEU|nr:alpha/beta hydrolase [Pseudonocardia humida]MCO1659279.1 alpha/beta hydrolase [Pseudonocardia humida]